MADGSGSHGRSWGVPHRRDHAVDLPPGEYYMVAVKDSTIQDSYDADMLESLVPLATIVRLDEGEKKTVDLKSKQVPR